MFLGLIFLLGRHDSRVSTHHRRSASKSSSGTVQQESFLGSEHSNPKSGLSDSAYDNEAFPAFQGDFSRISPYPDQVMNCPKVLPLVTANLTPVRWWIPTAKAVKMTNAL